MILAVTNRPPMLWSIIFAAVFVVLFGYRPLRLYIIGPLRSRGSPVKADLTFADISLDDFPETAKERVNAIAQMLASAGFSAASHARCNNHQPNTELFQSIWLSPAEQMIAIVHVVRIQSPRGPQITTVCQLASEFDDGTSIITSDSIHRPVLVPDPKMDLVDWPGVKPPNLLLQLHRARVARLKDARRAVLPEPGAALAHVIEDNRKSMHRQVAAGYYWHDAPNYVYRTTLKGACLMRWRMLRPWKEIAYSRNERRLRAELEVIGLQRWHRGMST